MFKKLPIAKIVPFLDNFPRNGLFARIGSLLLLGFQPLFPVSYVLTLSVYKKQYHEKDDTLLNPDYPHY